MGLTAPGHGKVLLHKLLKAKQQWIWFRFTSLWTMAFAARSPSQRSCHRGHPGVCWGGQLWGIRIRSSLGVRGWEGVNEKGIINFRIDPQGGRWNVLWQTRMHHFRFHGYCHHRCLSSGSPGTQSGWQILYQILPHNYIRYRIRMPSCSLKNNLTPRITGRLKFPCEGQPTPKAGHLEEQKVCQGPFLTSKKRLLALVITSVQWFWVSVSGVVTVFPMLSSVTHMLKTITKATRLKNKTSRLLCVNQSSWKESDGLGTGLRNRSSRRKFIPDFSRGGSLGIPGPPPDFPESLPGRTNGGHLDTSVLIHFALPSKHCLIREFAKLKLWSHKIFRQNIETKPRQDRGPYLQVGLGPLGGHASPSQCTTWKTPSVSPSSGRCAPSRTLRRNSL